MFHNKTKESEIYRQAFIKEQNVHWEARQMKAVISNTYYR